MPMASTKVKPASSAAELRAQRQAYLAALSPAARRAVSRFLTTIRALAPGAVEVFSYGIPGFRLLGRPLLWCAGFAHHVSLYPMTASIRNAHAKALKGYKMSTGTVQFPLDQPLPMPLVKRLIKARVTQTRQEAKASRR